MCRAKRALLSRGLNPHSVCLQFKLQRFSAMSAVLLEFGVCQGDSKLSEQIQKKHLSSEAVKLAIYAKSVLSTFIDQLNETYCVNTNFDEQLYACVDGVTIQLSDLLEHAATFASNPAGVTPPPGWDPAAKKAVVHLRLKKPIRRRQKKAQSVAAAAADTGDPTAPPSAPTPSSKVVTATDVFSKLTELIVTCVLCALLSTPCVRVHDVAAKARAPARSEARKHGGACVCSMATCHFCTGVESVCRRSLAMVKMLGRGNDS